MGGLYGGANPPPTTFGFLTDAFTGKSLGNFKLGGGIFLATKSRNLPPFSFPFDASKNSSHMDIDIVFWHTVALYKGATEEDGRAR